MYTRKLKGKGQNWGLLLRTVNHTFRSTPKVSSQCHYCRKVYTGECSSSDSDARRFCLAPAYFSSYDNVGECRRSKAHLACNSFRFYSSDSDGRNAREENKHVPIKDATNFDEGKSANVKVLCQSRHSNDHTQLGERDQQEWLDSKKLSIESKEKESPFLTRRQRFKNEFLRRVVPWEKLTVSWKTFPYYFNEHTKQLLVECAASHLKHRKFASVYGARLASSTGRILLQSISGTELYRERLVRALARDFQVPLLVLDSSVLAPFDFDEEYASESDAEDGNVDSGEGCSSESEVEEENDASNEEEYGSSNEIKSSESDDDGVDVREPAIVKKLAPYNLEGFTTSISSEAESTSATTESDTSVEESKRPYRKGDRVKYVGASVQIEASKELVLSGQRGEVYEVKESNVAVILDNYENKVKEDNKGKDNKFSIYWFDSMFLSLTLA